MGDTYMGYTYSSSQEGQGAPEPSGDFPFYIILRGNTSFPEFSVSHILYNSGLCVVNYTKAFLT